MFGLMTAQTAKARFIDKLEWRICVLQEAIHDEEVIMENIEADTGNSFATITNPEWKAAYDRFTENREWLAESMTAVRVLREMP